MICIRSIFFKLEVYHYAHSPLHIHDKIINDTLIMTLACQCNTIATTFCLYRKFRHVLLQNHSCISNDSLSFSHPDVFQSQLLKPCTTSDTDLFSEVSAPSLVPGTFSAAGFQLLVFPQESKLPRQEQNFLSHLIYPHQYLN